MQTRTHVVYYPSRKTIFRLYYLTDLHIGAKACDERQLKRDIETIKNDPYALWIGGGDYVDGICQAGDRRYRPSILARWALGHDDVMKVERKHTVGLLSPIAKKCVGLLKGNHEWAAEKFYARDLYWEIVLGVAEAAGVCEGNACGQERLVQSVGGAQSLATAGLLKGPARHACDEAAATFDKILHGLPLLITRDALHIGDDDIEVVEAFLVESTGDFLGPKAARVEEGDEIGAMNADARLLLAAHPFHRVDQQRADSTTACIAAINVAVVTKDEHASLAESCCRSECHL